MVNIDNLNLESKINFTNCNQTIYINNITEKK